MAPSSDPSTSVLVAVIAAFASLVGTFVTWWLGVRTYDSKRRELQQAFDLKNAELEQTARLKKSELEQTALLKMGELAQTQLRDILAKRVAVYPELWRIAQTMLSDWEREHKPVDANLAQDLLARLMTWHAENGVFFSEPAY